MMAIILSLGEFEFKRMNKKKTKLTNGLSPKHRKIIHLHLVHGEELFHMLLLELLNHPKYYDRCIKVAGF